MKNSPNEGITVEKWIIFDSAMLVQRWNESTKELQRVWKKAELVKRWVGRGIIE